MTDPLPVEQVSATGKIAILGVGLLGGSVAAALRRSDPSIEVIGYARRKQRCRQLMDLDIVDVCFNSIVDACRDAGVVVVGTPVDTIAGVIIEAAAASPENCLITDVGSTKANIVRAIANDPIASKKSIAAHPIAGSEKSGAEHADESLFDGKPIVLTPHANVPDSIVRRAHDFWTSTGGVVTTMEADQHDRVLAAISHVPHFASAWVARMTPPAATGLVGSGWRDITRVAAGDAAMWTAIVKENRAAILDEFDRWADDWHAVRELIQQQRDDELRDWFERAAKIRCGEDSTRR